jgi:acylphosphatase
VSGLTGRTRRHVVIHGRVQGVFFRDSAMCLARELGVAGWIHNRDDGAVEAVFEGPADAVDRMIDWARRGPPGARVDNVEIVEEPPAGETRFRVL